MIVIQWYLCRDPPCVPVFSLFFSRGVNHSLAKQLSFISAINRFLQLFTPVGLVCQSYVQIGVSHTPPQLHFQKLRGKATYAISAIGSHIHIIQCGNCRGSSKKYWQKIFGVSHANCYVLRFFCQNFQKIRLKTVLKPEMLLRSSSQFS